MADTSTLADRYRGTLLGLACGDALGGPVEFIARDEIARRFPAGVREMLGGGWLNLAPGEVTDDTQMTLALARSLAENDVLDMADVAARFVAWYESKPKDVGNTTAAALRLLAGGVPWSEAGERVLLLRGAGGAAGNGAIMRCAPVALRFRRDRTLLVRASLDTARITHADPRCTWGAVAVNQAIVHLLEGGEREEAPRAAIDGIPNEDLRQAVVAARDTPRERLGSGGFVLDTIRAAFWCLLHHASLEETVVAAVSLGDDADTTGAVAGALAGAHYGASAIPRRWLDLLKPRQELEMLADRLLARA
ncbi:MAG: ADP-ribosyl-[dinitrogen reductase] glycohydrolase [Thermomicrobiales bacterium]|nr:MAG: ADP-ribosyl-[dinitrogen reductase] glycohydrolase [Thermomicrobiales bacterium]